MTGPETPRESADDVRADADADDIRAARTVKNMRESASLLREIHRYLGRWSDGLLMKADEIDAAALAYEERYQGRAT